MQFANDYREVSVELDTSDYPENRVYPPFINALLIPFLKDPPWEEIGKLTNKDKKTEDKLARIDVNVDELEGKFGRIGIAYYELTFFVHSNSRDIKAIDFTYSDTIFNNYTDEG